MEKGGLFAWCFRVEERGALRRHRDRPNGFGFWPAAMPPPLLALRSSCSSPTAAGTCASHIAPLVATLNGAILTVAKLLVRFGSGLRLRVGLEGETPPVCFFPQRVQPLPSRGVGLTTMSSRCLCSSGLRLRVGTGRGDAPGVFLPTARPAAAISRRWVDHHSAPLPRLQVAKHRWFGP